MFIGGVYHIPLALHLFPLGHKCARAYHKNFIPLFKKTPHQTELTRYVPRKR
jgi:hypothetical protein